MNDLVLSGQNLVECRKVARCAGPPGHGRPANTSITKRGRASAKHETRDLPRGA